MKNTIRRIACIMMALAIVAAYTPTGLVWAVDGPSEVIAPEEADNASSGVNIEYEDAAAGNESGSSTDEDVINKDTEVENNDIDQAVEQEEIIKSPLEAADDSVEEATLTIDPEIKNGTVTVDGAIGTAVPDEGYDLATIRQICTDSAGNQHEQYLDYTLDDNGVSYNFETAPEAENSEITAYFFSLTKWDGAVDLTWYDPDRTEFEIGTPAQLAGLSAITNGMVDENVTSEYMIKDNAGRQIKGEKYLHRYVLTESAEADLLTPNHAEGAGQIRDIVWRLPETEKTNKIASDDLHHDFLYRTVRLTADIDMGEANWAPIGGKYAMNRDATGDEDPKVIDTRFQGILDGCGHTVTLSCNRMAEKGFPYAMEIAFIGYLGGGVDYKNGYPKDTYMDYEKYWVPTVRNLVIKGDIKGRRMVAGVVGRTGETNHGVLVENCANFADVYATDMRGCAGIVGAAWGKTVIRNCYNAGTVRARYWEHGGIVGSNGYEGSENRSPAGADIYNCYNIGRTGIVDTIADDPAYAGQEIGVDGQAFASYTVSNCYYPEPESEMADKTGYSIGETSKNKKVRITAVEAADLRSDETLAKLNANGEVFVKDTKNINNGYPVLYFQGEHGSGTADVTIVQTDDGTVSSKSDLIGLSYGTTVDFEAVPALGKRLAGYLVDDGVSEITIPANGFYTVSGRNVTVKGIFDDRVPSTLRFIEQDDGAPYYITVEKVYDADTKASVSEPLSSGSQVNMGDVIRIRAVDIRLTETQPDIKYLEYTGTFGDPEYTDRSLEVKDKVAKTYIVTGDVENVDITVSPKTQGKRWTTVADTSWYRQGETSFTITTARQLAGLAKLCNDGTSFDGITIKLGSDISLDNTAANSGDYYGYERSWIGIGSSERYSFKGIFDGQGHTISCMHRNFAPGYCNGSNGGLFGVTDGAVIKNVIVKGGSYVNDDGATMTCGFINGANGGSIVGTAINTTIENCTGAITMDKAFESGGIAGIAEGNTIIRNCISECVIKGNGDCVGGIVGKLDGESGVRLIYCINNGSIETSNGNAGGILGSGDVQSGEIDRCINTGQVKASAQTARISNIGGIVGYGSGRLVCSQCINKGSISGFGKVNAVGGIAGYIAKSTIEDCVNHGAIFSEGVSDRAQVAGITNTGTLKSTVAIVRNCYNTGTITKGEAFATNNYGGAIGGGNASVNVFQDIYCTDGSVKEIEGKAGVAGQTVSESQLKNLEISLGNHFFKDVNNVNDEFPILIWQDHSLIPSFITEITSIKAEKSNESAIKISWTADPERDGFELYRSINGGTEKVVYKGNDESYIDSGLSVGNIYTYRIRPYVELADNNYYGEWSDSASLELLLNAMKLSSVKNKKTRSAEIKWKRNKAAAGYEIFRSMSPNSGYKKVKTVTVTKKNKKKKTLSLIQKKLKKKKTYYYKIRYYKKINGRNVYSEFSAVKKVKIKK